MMTLTINLPPEKESRLREYAGIIGQPVEAFVMQAIDEKLAALLEQRARNQAAIDVIDRWLEAPVDAEDEAWDEFQEALGADHPSARKIFSE